MKTIGIDALKRAVEALGTQTAVARAVGVTAQAVSDMVRNGRRVPAEWCLPIERATSGIVTRHQLRPDLYPKEGVAA
jgi:DNA-binding transcriptional regulator YdaS (Cro superfamily)